MNQKNQKKIILKNLKEEMCCFKELMEKLNEQKKAIENQNEEWVLQVVVDKNVLIEKFKKLEAEIETQLQLLSPKDIEDLAQEGKVLKENIETLLAAIICLEEECVREIGSKMQEVEKRILRLQNGKKIGGGYGRYPQIRPLISNKI